MRMERMYMQQCVSHVVIIFIMLHITPLLAELELQSLATINFTSSYTQNFSLSFNHFHSQFKSVHNSRVEILLCMLITTAIFLLIFSLSLFFSLNFMLLSLIFLYYQPPSTHFLFNMLKLENKFFVFIHVKIS